MPGVYPESRRSENSPRPHLVLLSYPVQWVCTVCSGLAGGINPASLLRPISRIIPRARRENGSPSEPLSTMPGSLQPHFTVLMQ